MIENFFKYFKYYRIKNTFGSYSGFSKIIQDLIKTKNKHEFDNKMMEWILPIDSLTQFTEKCKELDIPYSITDFTILKSKNSSKIIKLEKYVNRYAVSFDYDEKLLEIIKKIDNRFWDKEPKRWLLPMHSFSQFTEDCQNIGFSIEYQPQSSNIENNSINIQDKNCRAYIKYDGHKFYLKLTAYINKIEEFKKIDKSVSYDKEIQTFTFSIDKLQEILYSLFKDNILWFPIELIKDLEIQND